MLKRLQLTASISLIALIFLCLLWEIWLAPLKPGGSWMMAKTFPLLAVLFGILKGRRYTYQVSSLLALLYVMEGSVRATSDTGPSQGLALIECLLAIVFFVSVVIYARLSAPSRQRPPPSPEQ